jgi:hypothetical protein
VVYLESQTDSLYLEKLPEVERHRASLDTGAPLSERKLAAMFARPLAVWPATGSLRLSRVLHRQRTTQ